MKSFKELRKHPRRPGHPKACATLPEVPDISMYEMICRSAREHPHAPAYCYMGASCSYAELIRKIDICAAAMSATGIRAGEIVCVCMPNTPEAVIWIYALNKIGAIANLIHPLSAEQEIKKYLNSVSCKKLLVIDLCLKKVESILDETALDTVVLVSASDSMPLVLKLGYRLTTKTKDFLAPGDRRYVSWRDFLQKGHGTRVAQNPGSNELPAVILHSGGTTGTPKEIVLSNRNFNSFAVQSVNTLTDISVGDSVLAVLPIFHGFGLGVCIHVTLCFGACAVLVARFQPNRFGKLLKQHKPTMIFGVPTLYEALLHTPHAQRLDLSFLKYIVSGGDALSPALEQRINLFLQAHGARVKISQGYGMTESLAATSLAVNAAYKPGSIGKPLPGNRFVIVAPGTQRVLPYGEDGEICVNGPTVMLGYRNNEQETNLALQLHNDGEIWLHTGDIGCMDSDGFLFYKLRQKRMLITSGYNVYPNHIERTIEEHPAVLKCTVIGIPHPYKVEVAKAYIVLKNGYRVTDALKSSIKEHCVKNLAAYCVPYAFAYRAALPQTLLGKVDCNRLRSEHLKKMQGGNENETE